MPVVKELFGRNFRLAQKLYRARSRSEYWLLNFCSLDVLKKYACAKLGSYGQVYMHVNKCTRTR